MAPMAADSVLEVVAASEADSEVVALEVAVLLEDGDTSGGW